MIRAKLRRHRLHILAAASAAAVVVVVFFGSYRFDPEDFDPERGGPLVIVDRQGTVLRRISSEDGRPGREGWVSLSDVSSHAVLTLIASEDQDYYEHGGVDARSLLRALWLNLTTDGLYGGSTITMQLARMVCSPGKPRTLWRKLLEVRAALGIERNLDKREILEQYLNRAYYGRGAYGIEAAAWRYFGKPARSLSVGESTFLAVLPRGPAHYDPLTHRDRVLARRHRLLDLLVSQGKLSRAEAGRAESQPITVALRPFEFAAPHFVDWVLTTIPEDVRCSGGTVHTTLDLPLQQLLEHRTNEHVRAQAEHGVQSAGVVVLDTDTGAVLAMVGSRDYRSPGGELNITTWRRFPGSALKPFVYATAIEERGDGPATIAYDVREISRDPRVGGTREVGPVAYREALAGSYNFAAMHVLERAGLERVMGRLRRAGVSELTLAPEEYGQRLALGATQVRLIDLVAGYRFLVRSGRVVGQTGVTEITNGGRALYRPAHRETRVFSPEASWLVMDMLSDPDARRPMFGWDLPVDLPYRVVAKTGTAEGFSDTVAVLATNELLVGAWTGRVDGQAIRGRPGMSTAAPLARAALVAASEGARLTLPREPAGLEEVAVCPLSGLRPGPACPHRRHDRFIAGTAPAEVCDWHLADGSIRYPDRLEGFLARSGRLAARDGHGARVLTARDPGP